MLSARGRVVALAWFTAKAEAEPRLHRFLQRCRPDTFLRPILAWMIAGALGRVDVELTPDGGAVASSMSSPTSARSSGSGRVLPSGAKSPAVTVSALAGGRASGYPRIARHGDELVFAWTESIDGRSQVQTAVMRDVAVAER